MKLRHHRETQIAGMSLSFANAPLLRGPQSCCSWISAYCIGDGAIDVDMLSCVFLPLAEFSDVGSPTGFKAPVKAVKQQIYAPLRRVAGSVAVGTVCLIAKYRFLVPFSGVTIRGSQPPSCYIFTKTVCEKYFGLFNRLPAMTDVADKMKCS
jgi:hypothetical protein